MSAAANTNCLPRPSGLGDLESAMFHRLLPLNLDNPCAANMPSLWKMCHPYLHQHRHHRLPENESLQSHAIYGCLSSDRDSAFYSAIDVTCTSALPLIPLMSPMSETITTRAEPTTDATAVKIDTNYASSDSEVLGYDAQ
ncbi:hypothetical protein SUNI508_11345 [Seiridium unicorne]|uniref:Uncharacterized protein n=1 Tax=Seiridium unicorne TaxID=138068 RepID=A0ABR2UIB7_9PEZI